MSRIVLTPGQIISGETVLKMLKIVDTDPSKPIEPTSRQNISDKDPLKDVKLAMEKKGLLESYWDSLLSPQKEFAGCM